MFLIKKNITPHEPLAYFLLVSASNLSTLKLRGSPEK